MADAGVRAVRISIPDAGLRIHADLQANGNQESVDAVWSALPLSSTFGHATGSGGSIWIPTTIVHLGKTRAVGRRVGSVYLNCAMQTLSMTYGDITESAAVNEVGRVRIADLGTLTQMGELVWQRTIAAADKALVRVRVERA